MEFSITIMDAGGAAKAQARGRDGAALIYRAPYLEGDVITVTADRPGYIVLAAEDSIAPVFGYLSGEYRLIVPFGEKRSNYSPKNFYGGVHLLQVRTAREDEAAAYRNLCFNPLDSHENQGFFPHATANVETRGEAQFAARNAINGNRSSAGHGHWPLESWGVNRQEDAEIRIDFGREVWIERLVFVLRADFPHDNWWQSAVIRFSGGETFVPAFVKTGEPQEFPLEKPCRASWLVMGDMKKDPSDSSPFPALTQIEAYGWAEVHR